MIEIRNKAGRAIRRSRNLRGVLDYARDVSSVQSVVIACDHKAGNYPLVFRFFDGSTCEATFADWRVAAAFLLARRSWRFGDWRDAAACDGVRHGPIVSGHIPAVARYYGNEPA